MVRGILLTHEQRLCFQNSVAEDDVIAANIAASQHQNYNNKNGGQSHNQNNLIPNKNGYGHKPSRSSNDGPNQGYQNNNTKRPQC